MRTSKDWLEMYDTWKKADREVEIALNRRKDIFDRAKELLALHPECGNMSSISEMIEREIGLAVLKERKEKAE